MNGGLWGYGSIDYALLMPQKVRQLMPKQVMAGNKISTILFSQTRHLQHLRRSETLRLGGTQRGRREALQTPLRSIPVANGDEWGRID